MEIRIKQSLFRGIMECNKECQLYVDDCGEKHCVIGCEEGWFYSPGYFMKPSSSCPGNGIYELVKKGVQK
jgi:hypothetical protein